jgi:predicted nucleotide-binding protein
MGYFIGKLNRAHVFLLLENGVEKPGDLDGIIYTEVDTEGMWKIKLAKRLKSVGYEINANTII